MPAAQRVFPTGVRVRHARILGPTIAVSIGLRACVIDFVEEVRALQHVRYADKKSFAAAAAWTQHEHAELMRKLSQAAVVRKPTVRAKKPFKLELTAEDVAPDNVDGSGRTPEALFRPGGVRARMAAHLATEDAKQSNPPFGAVHHAPALLPFRRR